ncbi:MAG: hypothetical protein J0I19_09030 [Alphaproteobacteria bacterium]|nr:hypothetical protein [Alphaproteobacteria bacterium]
MKSPLIGAIGLGFWLAVIPAIAQTPNPPPGAEKRDTGKSPQAARPAGPPAPAPQTPAAHPEELSHQAMVEEQERRDREAEAERDRDDL